MERISNRNLPFAGTYPILLKDMDEKGFHLGSKSIFAFDTFLSERPSRSTYVSATEPKIVKHEFVDYNTTIFHHLCTMALSLAASF